MSDHPRPGRLPDLVAPMLVRMLPMAVAIRLVTKFADVLDDLGLVRAALVESLGFVTNHSLSTPNVRTGYGACR